MIRIVLCLLMLASFYSNAYSDGACYNSSGSPVVSNFTVDSVVAPEHNKAGELAYSGSQNDGKTLNITCSCSSPSSASYYYWTATSDFPSIDSQYLQLTPELKIVAETWLYSDYLNSGGGNYQSIPFAAMRAGPRGACGVSNKLTGDAYPVRMTIDITKPIMGHASYHGTVGQVYLRRDANPVAPGDPPVSILNLDLDLTVPDNCTVRPGGVINVDLQSVRQGQFKGQAYPLPPKSYTPKSFDLTFDCNFSNADVDVTLLGTGDKQLQGFASSNPDVSVIITDNDNNIIPPNSYAGGVTVGSDQSTTTLHLKAYPTNLGKNAVPGASNYTATATIQLLYK